jgi:hypothetical protein
VRTKPNEAGRRLFAGIALLERQRLGQVSWRAAGIDAVVEGCASSREGAKSFVCIVPWGEQTTHETSNSWCESRCGRLRGG